MGRMSDHWISELDKILCQLEEGSMSAAEFSTEAKKLGLSDFDIVSHLGNYGPELQDARF